MDISDESLLAFIGAYERAHGERLSWGEARDAARRVLAFVKLLSQPTLEARTDRPDAQVRQTTPVRSAPYPVNAALQ